MEDLDYAHELSFETEHRLGDQIEGERALKKLEIYPNAGRAWTFTLLSAFLNELDDFQKPSRRGFVVSKECGLVTGRMAFTHQNIPKYCFYLIISNEITVYATTEWLIHKWRRERIAEFSSYRKDGKQRKYPITQVLEFFTLSFPNPSDGTKSLFTHSPLIFNTFYDFSNILHFFVKKIMKIGLRNDIDTSSLHEYFNIFVAPAKKSITSFEVLKERISGYLNLDIQQSTTRKRLATIVKEGQRYYIIGGVYLSPFAKSIIDSGDFIKGLLLDTTWKVMPMYVTSIIMGSAMNIGIPLGFAFGSGEDKSLYARHFQAFAEQMGIDLSKLVIESDQGSALEAICNEKFAMHLACLRHLLVSLRFSAFSYAAGELVKCTSLLDFNNALTTFNDKFNQITKPEELIELNSILGKIGLNFAGGTLNLVDTNRWNQVSMLNHINFRMPSTTNSLESAHGHLNKKTPRNNNFWASIYRLSESFMFQLHSLEQRVQHNYAYTKRSTVKKMNAIPQAKMDALKEFYSTTIDHCNCGDNKLVSAIMGIDIPCAHRCSLGATFPQCPKLGLPLNRQWSTLVVEFNKLPANQNVNPYDEGKGPKMYAVNIIRRYSGYSKKEDIEKYVEDNYIGDDLTFFISGKEVTLMQLIYRGIREFTQKRAVMKAEKTPHK